MSRLFDDASSQYLSGGLLQAYPFTLSCWFYSDDLTTRQTLISTSSGLDISPSVRGALELQGDVAGDFIAAYGVGSSLGEAISSAPYTANAWHHAVGVFNSQTSRQVYLDGANTGTDITDVGNTTSLAGTIGARLLNSTPSRFMSGRVAEAAVWTGTALTAADALLLASGVSPLKIKSPTRYYPLFGDLSPEISFTAVSGPLTLVGPPTRADHAPVAPGFSADLTRDHQILITSLTGPAIVNPAVLPNGTVNLSLSLTGDPILAPVVMPAGQTDPLTLTGDPIEAPGVVQAGAVENALTLTGDAIVAPGIVPRQRGINWKEVSSDPGTQWTQT